MQENKMGVMPINKLLVTMAVPMMLSMLVQALYNIVDSIYVAQISEDALTAVSLAFPFQNLMIAVGVGTGVGVNSLLSRLLGEKCIKQASDSAMNGVFLAFCSFVVFAVAGTLVVRPFFEMQTNVSSIVEAGVSYMEICVLFSFGMFMATMFEKLLAATGRTTLTMYTQLAGALTNIVLDPILIFGLLGMPAMGVAGAAIATVAGQWVSGLMGIILNHKFNHDIQMHYFGFRPDFSLIRKIYAVGLPSIIMQAVGSIMTFGMNQILIMFSTTAAAVFGVYFKLQSFVFLPVFGLNNGLVPIVAFNFGAGNPKRMMQTFKTALMYAGSIMLLGTLVFELFPEMLLSMFNASESMIAIGDPALRTIAISFILAAIGIECSGMFQATGHGMYSLWSSLIRQMVVLLPSAWLFAQSGNLNLVWLSFPLSELVSVLYSVFCLRKIYQKQIKVLTPVNADQMANA